MARRQAPKSVRKTTPAARPAVSGVTVSKYRVPAIVRTSGGSMDGMGIRARYEAAGNGSRAAESWLHARDEAPQYLLARDLPAVRRRCRYEVRNNPIARALVDYMTSTTIGSGLKPRIQSPVLQALWKEWVEDADADGLGDFYDLQALAFSEQVIAGEGFPRMRGRRPEDGLAVGFQVQVLPSEFVPLLDDLPENVMSGIRFGGPGQRSAYLMHRQHPNLKLTGAHSAVSVADFLARSGSLVPAEEVCHVMLRTEAGQIRGEPWLTRAIIRLHELDEYEDAELVKKNFTARLNLIMKKTSPAGGSGMIGATDPNEAEEAVHVPRLGAGENMVVPEGYEWEVVQTSSSGNEFPIFVRQILREACAGLAPVDLVLDDMQSPERSIQLSLKKYERVMNARRRTFIHQFCKPIWREFLRRAELEGAWNPTDEERRAAYKTRWAGEPLESIRPLQQAQADTERMRNGTLTHADAVEQYGLDYADHIDRLAIEAADRDRLGLIFDGDPRKTRANGTLHDRDDSFERDGEPGDPLPRKAGNNE